MHVYTHPCLRSWELWDREIVPGLSNSLVIFWKHAVEVLLQISKLQYSWINGELRNPSKSSLHLEPSLPPWRLHRLKAELIDITFGKGYHETEVFGGFVVTVLCNNMMPMILIL